MARRFEHVLGLLRRQHAPDGSRHEAGVGVIGEDAARGLLAGDDGRGLRMRPDAEEGGRDCTPGRAPHRAS
jgi:hypothetical protein